MIIDYSAHDTWQRCPAMWWEKYIAKRQLKWPKAQRSDALCLGGLVHAGLQVWQESHVVEIPNAAVEEFTPDLETRNLALELVYGYARRYPQELWPLGKCEEPVKFPLTTEHVAGFLHDPEYIHCDLERKGGCRTEVLTGLAKIDRYFWCPEATVIETGIPGQQMVLSPGWWIHEYKTKSPYDPIGLYMQAWEMNLQATYQMLALREKVKEPVQGVLVNVLEKPRRHIPKRKCQTCKETYEFATWLPTGTGEYACPVCGSRQKLQPLKLDTPTVPPEYYRFLVTRTQRELEQWRGQIIAVGQQMIHMAENGLYSMDWTTRNCVDVHWKRPCDYFGPHKNGTNTKDDGAYQDVPEYRGLVEIQ